MENIKSYNLLLYNNNNKQLPQLLYSNLSTTECVFRDMALYSARQTDDSSENDELAVAGYPCADSHSLSPV